MKILLPTIVASSLMLSACLKEENHTGPAEAGDPATVKTETAPERVWKPEENRSLIAKLQALGFDEKDIVDGGEHFLVEKDIIFEKAALEAEDAQALAKSAHMRSQYIVRDDKAHVLTVRVDATASPATNSWVIGTQLAITEWNNLGYFVKFQFVTGATADITVVGGYQSPMEWVMASTFPTSAGLPGNKIMARTDWHIDDLAKKYHIAHCLGHTIGLHHPSGSGVPVVGTTTKALPYASIPSTPGTDANSILNPIPYFEDYWPASGFSFGDSQAMRRLYSSHIKATANNLLRFVADANGDGKKDLVTFDEDGVVVSLANSAGTGYQNETLWNNQYGSRAASGGWTTDNNPRFLADVNGDGKVDVVGFGQAGVYVSLSNGSQFVPLASAATTDFCYNGGWRTTRHIRTLADVNGDGRADIVAIGDNDVLVGLGNTNGTFSATQVWHSNYGYNDGWNSVTDVPRMIVDVTGDGRADLVGFGYGNIVVSPSTGSSFTAAANSWATSFCYNDGWRDNLHIRTFADVNGDGKQDLVGFSEQAAVVGFSTGSGFNIVEGSPVFGRLDGYDKTRTVRLMADVNGDGKSDVVAFGETGTVVGLSNGAGFPNVTTWSSDFTYSNGWRVADHLRTVGDVSGDGKADIICLGYNEGMVGVSTGSSFTSSLYY